jgi:hypothetical protein
MTATGIVRIAKIMKNTVQCYTDYGSTWHVRACRKS